MKYEQMSGREFPRFSGIKTFFRLPHVAVDADYDIGIVGVPYDGAVSFRPGARFAPGKIREMSALGRGFNWSRGTHVWSTKKVADIGDCPTVPIDQNQTYERMSVYFDQLMKLNKKFIAVGGDHSLTLPLLRAVKKKHGVVSLIHFDAHLDTYPAAWNCEFHHGTFARHALEEGLIDPKRSIQIGIRGPLVDKNDTNVNEKFGLKALTVDDVRINGLEAFLKNLPTFNELPTYISFDVDCLDPVYAPGTGTPVVGGLTTYETQRILRALKVKNLVAADVVEVSPPFDNAELTSLAAVDTIFEYLCMM